MNLQTRSLSFAMGEEGGLLRVEPDMPAVEALDLAAGIADGAQYLCQRLHDVINEDCGSVLACEMRAIGFLAETAAALTRSVERSMKRVGGEQ